MFGFNIKNITIGTFAGGITLFLLGWLCYGILCADFMAANMMDGVGKPEEAINPLLIFLGNLVMAKLITIIYDKWAGITTFITGAKYGAMIGGMIAVSYGFISMGTANIMTWNAMACDVACNLVITAVAGGVIGWVLGKWGDRG